VLRGLGCSTGSAVEITALLVGELLLAGLEPDAVVSMDQTVSGRRAPLPAGTGVSERVAQRRELVEHHARGDFIDLGVGEIGAREVDEPGGHGAAGWRCITSTAPAGDERKEDREANHATVFDSAVARVKEV